MNIFKRLKKELEAASNKFISDADIISAIKISNSIRNNIHTLYQVNLYIFYSSLYFMRMRVLQIDNFVFDYS
ncbi:MAG: hypothetical protein ABIJ59_18995 [Pseudomonadota bacterium]